MPGAIPNQRQAAIFAVLEPEVNYKLTARAQFREERKIPRAENENRPAFHDRDAA